MVLQSVWRRRADVYDRTLAGAMRVLGIPFLRFSIAVVFIWFGGLKIVGYSPATDLATRTVYWVDPSWFVPFLGWWEVIIGLCFLHHAFIRVGIALLAPQMAGTFLPLIILPDVTFQAGNFLLPTLEGQYIIKNLVIIGAAFVIGASVRTERANQLVRR
jgi:uncharacterized membrane protein YkgB